MMLLLGVMMKAGVIHPVKQRVQLKQNSFPC